MQSIILYIHIIAGSIALFTGPVAMLNQDGRSLHRLSGKSFFYAMSVVFISAVYLSIATNNLFLLMIAVFSYHNIAIGYRALYLKILKGTNEAKPIDWMISITTALFNSGFFSWGLYQISANGNSFGLLGILFGGFGLYSNYRNIRMYLHGYKDKNGWLYIHISGMIAGYIATATAFLVNTVTFSPAIVLWLLPSAIFTPVIIYTLRKFKEKIKTKEIAEIVKVKIGG